MPSTSLLKEERSVALSLSMYVCMFIIMFMWVFLFDVRTFFAHPPPSVVNAFRVVVNGFTGDDAISDSRPFVGGSGGL